MAISKATTLNIDRGDQADKLMFEISKSCQGGNYIFACDDNKPAHVKLNYHLCDHFELFRHDIEGYFTGMGFSNIFYNAEEPFRLTVTYPKPKGGKSKAFITCEANSDGRILRFIISFSRKSRIDDAVAVGNRIMSDFFDRVTFYYRIPIAHKSIDVHAKESNQLLRKYVTIPYTTPLTLNPDAFRSQIVPDIFSPFLAKYREGMNSVSPLYRYLCYYSAYEGLQIVKGNLTNAFKKKGKTINREKLVIEDNPFTRDACPLFIGRKIDEFIRHYGNIYRNKIAHMFEKNSTAHIMPMEIGIIHTLDTVNQVMSQYLPALIQQEIKLFMAAVSK
ncbi:MAG: methylamine utilization protein MauJ [Sulfuricaulis sp.]